MKLKKCSCGGKSERHYRTFINLENMVYVQCENCCKRTGFMKTKKEADDQWNQIAEE